MGVALVVAGRHPVAHILSSLINVRSSEFRHSYHDHNRKQYIITITTIPSILYFSFSYFFFFCRLAQLLSFFLSFVMYCITFRDILRRIL